MRTPDAISKIKQELSQKMSKLSQKLGRDPGIDGFLRAEIKGLRRELRALAPKTKAQRRAGW